MLKVKTVVKEEKEKIDNKVSELRKDLETDITAASERRQQLLEEKLNFAKKQVCC